MGHDFRAAQKQDWLCHCHLQAHRDLLTWTGVHTISLEDSLGHLRHLCQESHAAARNDVISKLNQEQRQQQGKGKRKFQTDEGAPTSKAKGAQPPSSVSPKAAAASVSSSWGWSSWSWSQWETSFASIIHLHDILLSICIAVFLPSPYIKYLLAAGSE